MNTHDTVTADIKFKDILDFLNNHSGKPYKKPENIEDENDKQQVLQVRKQAREAISEFKAIGEHFKSKGYIFEKNTASVWLDGSNTKIRKYFWIELKKPDKANYPTSISIFAEKENGQARFRITLETKDSNSKEIDYQRHNRFLDILNPQAEEFEYFASRNKDLDLKLVTLEQVNSIIEKTKSRENHKLQIGKTISYDQVNSSTSEELMSIIEDTLTKLEPYYNKAVMKNEVEEPIMSDKNESNIQTKIDHEKNIILFGPPGTGKTYNTIKYAVAIIENTSIENIEAEAAGEGYDKILQRYREYKEKGQIAFTTFHQSYGYEEFIEGIKPVVNEEIDGDIMYSVEPGVFKAFCDSTRNNKVVFIDKNDMQFDNPTIWKISLEGAGDNQTKSECFKEGYIRIGWDNLPQRIEYDTKCESSVVRDIIIDFQDNLNIGDIVLSLYNKHTIDAVGVVTGEYEFDDSLSSYKRKRKVRWLATNIKENILSLNGNTQLTARTLYKLNRISFSDVMPIINKYKKQTSIDVKDEEKNYVFIIDEINRGNISKIFGELITLIEKQKRLGMDEEMKVRLPYSNKEFGVPDNVYILGTMNTADRSIALLDTALRRRFKFIEMMPDSKVLDQVIVEGINISKLLETINKRIEVLYDREHTI